MSAEPVSRRFASQGLSLNYVDWGNPAAPPLLLIHGTRDHARSWDWTARALRDRWRVVAVDLRGHGDSDWSPDGAYMTPYHVLDLIEMVETLGAAPVTIVAHSFGGSIASRYAGLCPDRVRKIVIVDGLGPDLVSYARWTETGPVARTREWTAQRRRSAPPTRLATVADAAVRMAKANPHLSPARAQHLAEHGVRRHADGYGWKFDPRVGMFAPEDFAVPNSQYWREITAPVLILYGEKSWISDPRVDGRAAQFPDQRTVSFADAGHWIHHDQLGDFLAALDAFL